MIHLLQFFLLLLEVLAIRICGDESTQGVTVEGKEIKLEIFEDDYDLAGFVSNKQSFNRFLNTTEFGECSGLCIN